MPGDSLNFTPHSFINSDLLNYALKQCAGRTRGTSVSEPKEGERESRRTLGLVNKCLLTEGEQEGTISGSVQFLPSLFHLNLNEEGFK